MHGVAGAGLPPGHMLPRVSESGTARTFDWCAVYRAQLPVDDGVTTDDVFAEAGPRLVSLDFDATDAYQSVYAGRTLYVGGAVTYAYDGVGFVEAAPFYAPDWETGAVLHTSTTAGVGGMAMGFSCPSSSTLYSRLCCGAPATITGPLRPPFIASFFVSRFNPANT